MARRDPNYIALGCAIAYILCFLFLPFYRILVVNINGWTMMQYNAVLCLPLVVGVLMALASLLFSPKISIGIGAASLVLVFILLLAGGSLLLKGNALTAMATNLLSGVLSFDLSSSIPLSIGFGGIFTILLGIGFIVAEVLANAPKSSSNAPADPVDWDH